MRGVAGTRHDATRRRGSNRACCETVNRVRPIGRLWRRHNGRGVRRVRRRGRPVALDAEVAGSNQADGDGRHDEPTERSRRNDIPAADADGHAKKRKDGCGHKRVQALRGECGRAETVNGDRSVHWCFYGGCVADRRRPQREERHLRTRNSEREITGRVVDFFDFPARGGTHVRCPESHSPAIKHRAPNGVPARLA